MRNYNGLKKRITSRPIFSSLLLVLFSIGAAYGSDYFPPRVAYIEGTAAYEPAGNVDWDEVTVNLPLLSGDRIFTHASSRTEIELGEANFVRLAEETDLVFAEVSDKEMVLLMHTGDMIVRVNKSQKFQIRTPQGTVFFRKEGVYRLRVREDGRALLLVREGKAEFHTPAGKEKLKTGEQIAYGPNASDMAQAVYMDPFETWSDRRDARMVSVRSASYVGGRYYPGVVDLDYYGNWIYDPSYGNMWVPHAAFSVGWTPFRVGRWGYLSFGWTWLSAEPWGWLPYHYGNWVYYGPGSHWCWVPGGFNHWSPHRVNFYFGGGYVGWAPYGYSPWGRGGGHNTYIDNRNIIVNNNNTTIINNGRGRGGTVVREDEFGSRQRVRNITDPDQNRVRNLQAGLPRNLENPVMRGRSSTVDRGRSMADRGTGDVSGVRRDAVTGPRDSIAGGNRTRGEVIGTGVTPTRNDSVNSRARTSETVSRTTPVRSTYGAASSSRTNRPGAIAPPRNATASPGVRTVPGASNSGTARYRTPSTQAPRRGDTVRPNSGVRTTRPSPGDVSRPNTVSNPGVVRSAPRTNIPSVSTGRIQASPRPTPRISSTPSRSTRPSVNSAPRSSSRPSYRVPSRSSSQPSYRAPSRTSPRPSVSRPSIPSSRPSVSRPASPPSRPASPPASRPKRPN